ncbi:hypothetical protein AVO45_07895 [Ruegeria marisrubri]|uniref:Uncharacterized protein n=1 Tax=Ruegeria marisrubri TaxID=1685379 RepID=A0A0X3TQD0_9RHOB|nr:hypothetical protein AVO45_07895 [Ruegeria marisrubri]
MAILFKPPLMFREGARVLALPFFCSFGLQFKQLINAKSELFSRRKFFNQRDEVRSAEMLKLLRHKMSIEQRRRSRQADAAKLGRLKRAWLRYAAHLKPKIKAFRCAAKLELSQYQRVAF